LNKYLKTLWRNSWVELAARWILGLTFIYASYHKILAPSDFAKIVYGYNLFPDAFVNLIAIIVPFLELVAGLSLIFGFYPRAAALIVNGLLIIFVVILSINLIRGHEFDCGCFSLQNSAYSASSESMIIRDFIYLVLGLQVFLYHRPRKWCISIFNRNDAHA
jgi:uncharacterized membrane protein YphA (DoxX/SURF4 family)